MKRKLWDLVNRSAISWQRASLIAAVWIAAILFLQLGPHSDAIEMQLARKLEFSFRSFIGKDPRLDPRIKIYALDDPTVGELDSKDLDLKQWADLFEGFAKAKPAGIFIDNSFGDPRPREYAKEFVSRMKKMNVPLVSGAFVTSQKFTETHDLDFKSLDYDLGAFTQRSEKPEKLPPLPISTGYPHGPHKLIKDAFKHVGHFRYAGYNHAPAFVRISEEYAIPHWSLFADKKFYFDNSSLFVNGFKVPIDAKGQILINLVPKSIYDNEKRSLRGTYDRIRDKMPLTLVHEGDYVVILPGMYSGNLDWKDDTPHGLMPGGYLMVAMLNSVLTGEWLKPIEGGVAFTILFSLAALVIGIFLHTTTFFVSLLSVESFLIAGSLFVFSFFGYVVPWCFSALSFLFIAVSVFAEKTRVMEKRSARLTNAFSGLVSESRLKEIIKKPGTLQTAPCERIVSVMFIDIEGFSVAAEKIEPGKAFDALKELLGALSEKIHSYGGVVDRSLGDGLLCFFGYHYDGSKTHSAHATQAMDCAIEIQRLMVERNIFANDNGKTIFPLRIGINTAAVYIGDLGNEKRIDFTVIGDGVNFAQRLESACDNYCVMIGASTYDSLTKLLSAEVKITKRFIQIKHHEELIEAYEVDPLANQQEFKNRAIEAYREYSGIRRKDQRWPVSDDTVIKVYNDFTSGQLVNFSSSGLAVVFEKYIGKGVQMPVFLGNKGDALFNELSDLGLNPLICEVRWGRLYRDGKYLHGLLVKNVNTSQKENLLKVLRKQIRKPMLEVDNAA